MRSSQLNSKTGATKYFFRADFGIGVSFGLIIAFGGSRKHKSKR